MDIHHRHHKITNQSKQNREAKPSQKKQDKESDKDRANGITAYSLTEQAERNENDEHDRPEHGHRAKRHQQKKQKIAVSLTPIFAPRLYNGCAISSDAVGKNKIAACLQPHKDSDQNKNQDDDGDGENCQPWLPLTEIWQREIRIRLAWIKASKREIEPDTGKMSRQKCGETNNEPFFEIEWLKKNFLHLLKRFAKWLEDLDLCTAAIHATI